MSARGKATYRPREAAQTPGTRETAEAPGTPVMLEMVEIPVMPAWAETSVSVIPGGQRPGRNQTAGEMQNSVNQLFETMRLAWLELIYWTRMYMMSVDSGADAKEQYAVEGRLLETADAITDVFAERLPVAVTRQLRNLLVEHVEMTGQIIRTLKSGDKENYEQQIREWYANANQIATLLADQNPYFAGKETRNLLLNYLDMTREIIEHQMNGEYDQSIDTFRDLSDLVLELADYLARGLLAR